MGEEGSRRRRRPPPIHTDHGGHHGGAWKVAYADFTTAMMAFFLLLWIVASSSPSQKASIASYFRDDGPFKDGGATKGGGNFTKGAGMMPNSGDQIIKDQAKSLQKAGEDIEKGISGVGGGAMSDQVQISMTEEGLVIEIADDEDDAIFEVGSAAMAPKFARIFDELAHGLAELPNRIRVEGYTDSRQYPDGASYTNWELSADRANAARRRLESQGLARERFESITGYGDGYPAIKNDPLAPGNRRITLTVLHDKSPVVGQAIDADPEDAAVVESPYPVFFPRGSIFTKPIGTQAPYGPEEEPHQAP